MSQANKDLVRRYVEAGNALEIEDMLSLLDRDRFVNANMAIPPLGFEKTYDEFAEMVRQIPEYFGSSLQLTIHALTAEDDRVAVKATSTARTTNGVDYANNYHFLFNVKDGKITRIEEYLCSMTMAKLLDPAFWTAESR